MPTNDEPVKLFNADCMDVLPTLGKVDAVVTDPPFGVRGEDWDDMSRTEFCRFTMSWLAQVRRMSDTLVSFFASGMPFMQLCEPIYKRTRQLIWHKPLGSQYAGASECKMWFAYEPIAHCYSPERWEVVQPKEMRVADLLKQAREAKGMSRGAVDMALRGKKTGLCFRWEEAACIPTPEQAGKLKNLLSLNGEFDAAIKLAYEARNDVLEKAAEKAAEKTDVFSYRTITNGCHPCEKPVRLLADIIECTTEPGDLILDPFAGSGTVAVACILTGRLCISIEQDAGHFKTAQRRINEALGIGGLFPAKKPAAVGLFEESAP